MVGPAGRVRFLEWEEEARLFGQASEPLRTTRERSSALPRAL